jgi:uncharacterized repeat protein (TIGR02543 family)
MKLVFRSILIAIIVLIGIGCPVTNNQLPTFHVFYNGNGNTGGSNPVDSTAYSQGSTVIVRGNTGGLISTGYLFSGWNTLANGNGVNYSPGQTFTIGTSNMTLYAKWTLLITYTVAYDGNGNDGGLVPVDSNAYTQGSTVIVPGNTGVLTCSGYSFAGWNTFANGSGTNYIAGQTFTMGTSNVTLYAKWTSLITYTVTYDGNGNDGGLVPVDSNAYTQGSTVIVPGNTGVLTYSGYTFSGWNTLANGSGTNYTTGQTFIMGTSNITLYAKWTVIPTYFVFYSGNGNTSGSVPIDGNSYIQGSDVTVMGNINGLVKTGYSFKGWNTNSSGTGTNYLQDETFTMGNSNITLYAKWAPYALRDIGPAGGVIFYDKGYYSGSPSWRYLEAAPNNQSVSIGWGGYGIGPITDTGTGIGTGRQNTINIVSAVGTGSSYAARICDTLVIGSFSDWFLPSKDELNLMYTNLTLYGLGGLAGIYWCSTDISANFAWLEDFGESIPGDQYTGNKLSNARVRAIRSF